jgi:hypothetical protein
LYRTGILAGCLPAVIQNPYNFYIEAVAEAIECYGVILGKSMICLRFGFESNDSYGRLPAMLIVELENMKFSPGLKGLYCLIC